MDLTNLRERRQLENKYAVVHFEFGVPWVFV